MSGETLRVKRFDGTEVEIVGPTYEKGKPDSPANWRAKIRGRAEMIAYLQTADRYWTAKEGFGSEKRKTPA